MQKSFRCIPELKRRLGRGTGSRETCLLFRASQWCAFIQGSASPYACSCRQRSDRWRQAALPAKMRCLETKQPAQDWAGSSRQPRVAARPPGCQYASCRGICNTPIAHLRKAAEHPFATVWRLVTSRDNDAGCFCGRSGAVEVGARQLS
ncbi:hypothetical protein WJX81_006853 [Elliptochloris bilobata]|uniref:Uncharacterized protein n=1 Tax=Elliptochloris bilobata TaxID=381761 RepID=A0AAW1RQW9_9CHLO